MLFLYFPAINKFHYFFSGTLQANMKSDFEK